MIIIRFYIGINNNLNGTEDSLINPRIKDEKGLNEEVENLIDDFKKKPLESSLDGNHHVENALETVSDHITYHLPEKTAEELQRESEDEGLIDDQCPYSSSSVEGLSSEEDWEPRLAAEKVKNVPVPAPTFISKEEAGKDLIEITTDKKAINNYAVNTREPISKKRKLGEEHVLEAKQSSAKIKPKTVQKSLLSFLSAPCKQIDDLTNSNSLVLIIDDDIKQPEKKDILDLL
jgi:hypothetical protein